MTVSTLIAISGPYDGNDLATSFAYDFKIYNKDHLQVILTSTLGAESILQEGTDYTVSGVGVDAGGAVAYPVSGSPLATGEKLTLKRIVPKSQESDYTNTGGYVAANHERSYDLLQMQIQDVQEEVDRSVKVAISSGTDPDALIASLTTDAAAAAASKTAAETAETNAETAEAAAVAAKVLAEAAAVDAAASIGGVKVSSDDTTPSDLESKVLASGLVGLSTQNSGANETRTIDVPIASQVEAEAGTAADKAMTPLRVAQAIAALASSSDQTARDGVALLEARFAISEDLDEVGLVNGYSWQFETDSMATKTGFVYNASTNTYGNRGTTDIGTLSETKTGSNAALDLQGSEKAGMRFTTSGSGTLTITGAKVDVHAVNTSGNITAEVWTNNSGNPGAKVGATSAALNVTTTGEQTLTFSTPVSVSASTSYWIVLFSGGADLTLSSCASTATFTGMSSSTTGISDGGNVDGSEDLMISAVELGAGSPTNGTLNDPVPSGRKPTTAPDTITVYAIIDPATSVTYGTDVVLGAKRTAGASFTENTTAGDYREVSVITIGAVDFILFAVDIDLSGTTSGTDPYVQIRVPNGDEADVAYLSMGGDGGPWNA